MAKMEFTREENARFYRVLEDYRTCEDEELLLSWANMNLSSGYKWMREIEYSGYDDYQLLESLLCSEEDYDTARKLIDIGYNMSPGIMLWMVETLDLKAAKWLKDHGCPWDKKSLMKGAQRRGNRRMIEWVKSLD